MKKQQKIQTQTGSAVNSPKFHMHQLLVRFSPSLTRMQQQRLLSESVIEILSDPMFFIRDNYFDQNWKQILPYIQQSYCRRFFLRGIGQNSILREISMIKFSCLKQIDLSSNKIDNLQLISMVKLPYVKSIVLRNNYITNINTLRKGKWKDIEQIDLQGNYFIQWGKVGEIYTCPSVIQSFDVGFYSVNSITDIQDIAMLYAKYMTNNDSQQISRNFQIFNHQNQQQQQVQLLQQGNQQQQNRGIIALGKKRYQALKRKFQKK